MTVAGIPVAVALPAVAGRTAAAEQRAVAGRPRGALPLVLWTARVLWRLDTNSVLPTRSAQRYLLTRPVVRPSAQRPDYPAPAHTKTWRELAPQTKRVPLWTATRVMTPTIASVAAAWVAREAQGAAVQLGPAALHRPAARTAGAHQQEALLEAAAEACHPRLAREPVVAKHLRANGAP